MKTTLLLLIPTLLNLNGLPLKDNTSNSENWQYAERSGRISMNQNQVYTNINNNSLANTTLTYLSQPTPNYNTGGLEIGQKTYIAKSTININVGTQQLPSYRTTNIIEIVYILRYKLTVNEVNGMYITLNINWPTVADVFNAEDGWNYYKYTGITGNANEQSDLNRCFESYENNYTQIATNISTIKSILNTYESGTLVQDYEDVDYNTINNKSYYTFYKDTTSHNVNTGYYYNAIRIYYNSQMQDLQDTPQNYTYLMNFSGLPYNTSYAYGMYYTPTEAGTIDLTNLLLTIVAMPFAFISQAFNFTFFAGTAYAINVSRILMAIIVFGLVLYIIRRYVA